MSGFGPVCHLPVCHVPPGTGGTNLQPAIGEAIFTTPGAVTAVGISPAQVKHLVREVLKTGDESVDVRQLVREVLRSNASQPRGRRRQLVLPNVLPLR